MWSLTQYTTLTRYLFLKIICLKIHTPGRSVTISLVQYIRTKLIYRSLFVLCLRLIKQLNSTYLELIYIFI